MNDESDNEGLPLGFVPLWTYVKTEDGVVEYVHPAGESLMSEVDDDAVPPGPLGDDEEPA